MMITSTGTFEMSENHLSKDALQACGVWIVESGVWEKILDHRYRFGLCQSAGERGMREITKGVQRV